MQQICIYRDHKKFPNTENTKNFSNIYHAIFPCTNGRDHKIFYYKKTYNKFLHTDNFQFIPAFKCLYPAKTAKTSYGAKSKITYIAKKKTRKPFSSYSNTNVFFFNFAQNNIGTTPFFTAK